MSPRRKLLYVSPVVPATNGNGLAMRSGLMIELLARQYDVFLLTVPLHGHTEASPPSPIVRCCRAIATIAPVERTLRIPRLLAALGQPWTPARHFPDEWRNKPYADESFDVVHAFRMTALPYAVPYFSGGRRAPARHLDLDEAESSSRKRMSDVYRAAGDEMVARFADLESRAYASLESASLRSFDRVYVSSHAERASLAAPAAHAEIRVVPNALASESAVTPIPIDDPFRFLFVGTLGFPANEDAVLHFCESVLPRLRSLTSRRFELTVVGSGATGRLLALHEIPEVCVIGSVPDVDPWYARAHAVVVPLRAGGGTRLKVLEAMGRGRPIVSTVTGVEGIAVTSGTHALVADSAEMFAAHCGRLMREPALGARLARNALELVRRDHSPAAAVSALFP